MKVGLPSVTFVTSDLCWKRPAQCDKRLGRDVPLHPELSHQVGQAQQDEQAVQEHRRPAQQAPPPQRDHVHRGRKDEDQSQAAGRPREPAGDTAHLDQPTAARTRPAGGAGGPRVHQSTSPVSFG